MKIKLVVSVLLVLLALAFVVQNTKVAQVALLAWSVEVSLSLLVFITLGVGVIVGWLLNSYVRFSRNRKRQIALNNAQQGHPETIPADEIETQKEREET